MYIHTGCPVGETFAVTVLGFRATCEVFEIGILQSPS